MTRTGSGRGRAGQNRAAGVAQDRCTVRVSRGTSPWALGLQRLSRLDRSSPNSDADSSSPARPTSHPQTRRAARPVVSPASCVDALGARSHGPPQSTFVPLGRSAALLRTSLRPVATLVQSLSTPRRTPLLRGPTLGPRDPGLAQRDSLRPTVAFTNHAAILNRVPRGTQLARSASLRPISPGSCSSLRLTPYCVVSVQHALLPRSALRPSIPLAQCNERFRAWVSSDPRRLILRLIRIQFAPSGPHSPRTHPLHSPFVSRCDMSRVAPLCALAHGPQPAGPFAPGPGAVQPHAPAPGS